MDLKTKFPLRLHLAGWFSFNNVCICIEKVPGSNFGLEFGYVN